MVALYCLKAQIRRSSVLFTKVKLKSVMEEQQPVVKQPNPYAIPISIVLGSLIVATSVYLSLARGPVAEVAPTVATPPDNTSLVREVTEEDYVRGPIDAPVTIVTYSDFECPFCQRFHNTMREVMDKYSNGEVAWVFRQFPLEQLHPVKAYAAALASECAAEQGGDEVFWKFADRYFELTLTNNRTDLEVVVPQIATELKLDMAAFKSCQVTNKYQQQISADIANAGETGGGGTPWSILIGPDGKTYPINGALPVAAIEQLIAAAQAE